MNKRIFSRILLVAMLVLVFTACGKKKDKKKTETETTTTTEATAASENATKDEKPSTTEATTEKPKEDKHKGLVQSDLTGEWIKPEDNAKRPIGVMINNIDICWPHSGIAKADIVYEMTCEGGITRLLCMYSDYSDLDKIGSVRSARQYFVLKCFEHDGILVHVGGSTYGKAAIRDFSVDDIDGIYEGVFYRTNDREAPHNCYIDTDGINSSIDSHGYSRTHGSSYKKIYSFNEEDTDLKAGEKADKVTCRYNSFTKPYFEYDSKKKVYNRFEYGEAHIDDQTGEQLTFKNILVVFSVVTPMPEGSYNDVALTGSGTGYYATNGKIIPIKWEKKDDYSVTKFTTEDGKELLLNPGKTCVEYFDVNDADKVTWE
ncbi:MAG: DUF3048 domain-containing protein [Eubacterium sp.]|nr:DUF3048 domain-containing protein [Eubacterium sp.]